MLNDKALSILKSYARVFLATTLALFLADGADVFAVDVTDLRTWFAAGIASVVPVVLRALDSSDTVYGRGSDKTVAPPD